MISSKQCRAARVWAELTQLQLAKAANVAPDTITKFERGVSRALHRETENKLLAAFEEHGVRLLFRASGTPAGIEEI